MGAPLGSGVPLQGWKGVEGGWRRVLKGRAEIGEAGQERGVVCFLGVEGVFLSTWVGAGGGVGGRCERESSVCTIGVVASWVVLVQIFLLWL